MKSKNTEYYTPKDLSLKLNVALKTITKWTQSHRIPGQVKLGGVWRYRATAIEKALLRGQFLQSIE